MMMMMDDDGVDDDNDELYYDDNTAVYDEILQAIEQPQQYKLFSNTFSTVIVFRKER